MQSMSVLGSCCESWRPLSTNTRASTRWTSSVQLEPSSPRSKVSYDDQISLKHIHTHNSQLSRKTYQLLLHSSFSLFSVSAYLIPPSPLTALLDIHCYYVLSLTLSPQVLKRTSQGMLQSSFLIASKQCSSSEVTQVLRMQQHGFQTPYRE